MRAQFVSRPFIIVHAYNVAKFGNIVKNYLTNRVNVSIICNKRGRNMDTLFLYIVAFALFAVSALKDREKTKKALMKGLKALEGIFPQFLAVLVFVAIVLAVFNAETISRFIGEGSGILGTIAAALIGAVTLIPGFVAFPAAGELLRNGAGTVQIATFVSTLMMVGIVTLPMEIKYFGKRAAIARNSFAFLFSFVAAVFVAWVVAL